MNRLYAIFCYAVALGASCSCSLVSPRASGASLVPTKTPIPWSNVGAQTAADYHGDGLAISPTTEGARIRCVFQRLEGEATRDGLWLTSTITNGVNDRFRVTATEVTRLTSNANTHSEAADEHLKNRQRNGAVQNLSELSPLQDNAKRPVLRLSTTAFAGPGSHQDEALASTGTVAIDGQAVRFDRPGLIEEYSVSMDGVRQDFLVLERPTGAGELALRLAVSGARVEATTDGVQLILEKSGRKIAYSQLRATDAIGKELTVHMEIPADADARQLLVHVNDAKAEYPVRIDPTFSDANWVSMGDIPGANGVIRAEVVDAFGNLYVGGDFTIIGDVMASHIAKWDGKNWSALTSGINSNVLALAAIGSDLYVGGRFTTAGGSAATNIAKWNGHAWSPLGLGVGRPSITPNEVAALAVSGSDLYVGGTFAFVGVTQANAIAKWNGSSWSTLGTGMGEYGNVLALAVSGNDLYVGGSFTTAGGTQAYDIARWNGSNWSALGSGVDGFSPVYALALAGNDLYAGGYFRSVGGNPENHVARWDGTNWSALGFPIAGKVRALAVIGSNVYAGGEFVYAGPATNPLQVFYITKSEGTNWARLASGMNNYVSALTVSGNHLYAAGAFRSAGGNPANSVASWDGTNWSALGSGMYGQVSALTVLGSNLYVGGSYQLAGGSAANDIAKWDGSSWSNLGSTKNLYLEALATVGSDLYVGGSFLSVADIPANYIAMWNGSGWSALGSGMNGPVAALAAANGGVYAGGSFTTAGGGPATNIARWNSSSWSPLGSGLNGVVYALAGSDSEVYAGGSFTMAGGIPANYVAKWDGASWSALSSGISGAALGYGPVVLALTLSDSALYVGGVFTNAGGIPANCIARWDGSNWSALGSGTGGTPLGNPLQVVALALSGSNLYAGGYFTTAGGNPANYIAKWDGTNWSAMGSGMNANVNALVVSGNYLYAGGSFTIAGGKVSAYIARAYLPTLPTLSALRSGPNVVVSWPSVDGSGFSLEQSDMPAIPPIWVSNAASISDDGTNKSVITPATLGSRFFRLRGP